MQTFLIIVGLAIIFFAIVALFGLVGGITGMKSAKKDVKECADAPSRGKSADAPSNDIRYISKTRNGSQSCSKSFFGSSTSSTSRSYGRAAGSGKVVTIMAEIAQLTAGCPIKFKAIVSHQNLTKIHNLVAYICEEFCGLTADSNPIRQTNSYWTSPLLVELADGEIQIINDDYGLTIQVTEQSIDNVVQGRAMFVPQEEVFVWDETTATGTKQYCGLEPGDEVVVTGKLVLAGARWAVEAEHIKMSR